MRVRPNIAGNLILDQDNAPANAAFSVATAHVTLGNTISSKRDTKGCPRGLVSGPTSWNIISDLIPLFSN